MAGARRGKERVLCFPVPQVRNGLKTAESEIEFLMVKVVTKYELHVSRGSNVLDSLQYSLFDCALRNHVGGRSSFEIHEN